MIRAVNPTRVVVTTLLGFWPVCFWWWMGHLPAAQAIAVIVSRMILGFPLGISGWRVHWTVHGLVLGAIFSLPQGFWSIGMGWGAACHWIYRSRPVVLA